MSIKDIIEMIVRDRAEIALAFVFVCVIAGALSWLIIEL